MPTGAGTLDEVSRHRRRFGSELQRDYGLVAKGRSRTKPWIRWRDCELNPRGLREQGRNWVLGYEQQPIVVAN
jgi:hypothetical protein